MTVASGVWVECPRCADRVALARFADDEDEPGIAVAICPGCAERVHLVAPSAVRPAVPLVAPPAVPPITPPAPA